MYPLSDKDLDRLSREAAEQYNIEPAASGWEQLEERLNQEIPAERVKDRKRFLWIFFLLALLLGSGLTWVVLNNRTNNGRNAMPVANNNKINTLPDTKRPEALKNEATAKPADITQRNDQHPNFPDQSSSPSSKNSGTRAGLKVNSPASSVAIASQRPPGTQNDFNGPGSISEKGLLQNSGPGHLQESFKAPAKEVNPFSIAKETGTPNRETTLADVSGPSLFASIPGLQNRHWKLSTIQATGLAWKNINSAPADKSNTKENRKSAFSVGLLAGSDFSRIHASSLQAPGYNLGLVAEYRIGRRWAVGTGFVITKKNYKAAGSDYHPPKHYWTNYVNLDHLEGSCYMWDIPLNVRYNLNLQSNKQWFVSAGLSNYIMKKQDYTYYYTYNNTPTYKDWSYGSQDNYWMGILNLSGGMEKRLTPAFSLQAEPFIKIPLKGVGFGNMDISSYGLYLTLKFTPVRKSKSGSTAAPSVPLSSIK